MYHKMLDNCQNILCAGFQIPKHIKNWNFTVTKSEEPDKIAGKRPLNFSIFCSASGRQKHLKRLVKSWSIVGEVGPTADLECAEWVFDSIIELNWKLLVFFLNRSCFEWVCLKSTQKLNSGMIVKFSAIKKQFRKPNFEKNLRNLVLTRGNPM